MSVKLLTGHHLEFLSLNGDCASSSESTLVKMPHCWKSQVAAHELQTFGFGTNCKGDQRSLRGACAFTSPTRITPARMKKD